MQWHLSRDGSAGPQVATGYRGVMQSHSPCLNWGLWALCTWVSSVSPSAPPTGITSVATSVAATGSLTLNQYWPGEGVEGLLAAPQGTSERQSTPLVLQEGPSRRLELPDMLPQLLSFI